MKSFFPLSEEGTRSGMRVLSLAVASTAFVTLLRLGLQPVLGEGAPLLPFLLAVSLNAWYGGLLSGLGTTGISCLIGTYLFMEPQHSLRIRETSDVVLLLLFVSLGCVISVLTERLHRSRGRAEQHAAEVLAQKAKLEREVNARREIAETLRKLSRAVEQSPVALAITDPSGSIEYVNPKFSETTGYSLDEVSGIRGGIFSGAVLPPEVQEEVRRAVRSGREWQGEFKDSRRNGEVYTAQALVSPLLNEGGEITHFIVLHEDVSERRRLEGQIRQASRMEALGRLAGGVTHDFNNLLTIILGYCDLLQNSLAPNDPRHGDVEEVRKAGQRGASLTSQLLAFSRRQMRVARVLDLNAVVADVEKMLRRVIGEDITLKLVLEDDLDRVYADPGQIEQILVNLALNARDAMPGGGSLIVETANVELGAEYSRRHASVGDGRYVRLTVSDTGVGMDAETLNHAFEPFFTTKAEGKGTGLGLATVYGIVKQNDGHILAYSEPGHGSTFKVYLPCVDQPAEELPESAVVDSLRGNETVLIAEDEQPVRILLKRTLASRGYRVLEAADGREAVTAAAGHAGRIDLFLTDVVMPGLGGRDAAREILSKRPDMKVLFLSGYTASAIAHNGTLDSGFELLQKPFSPETLLRRVRELLGPGEERVGPA